MIRVGRTGLFFLLSLPLALGQAVMAAQSPSTTPAAQLCKVEGIVVRAATGLPLRKISLHLYNRNPRPASAGRFSSFAPSSYSAVSDLSGHFVFPSVIPGEYTLQGQGNDYPYQFYDRSHGNRGMTGLRLTPGEDLKNIEFRLEPGVVVTGKVVDEDGDPVERASVWVFFEMHNGEGLTYIPGVGSQTDDRGEYRIFGMRAGRFYIAAAPGGRQSASGGVYMTEFYPGTTDPSEATPIDSHPGDVLTDIDMALVAARPAQISGQLINGTSGEPLKSADLSLRPSVFNASLFWWPTAGSLDWGPQGQFRMTGVAPGSYVLITFLRNSQTNLYGQFPVQLSPGEDLPDLRVVLYPAIELSGQVSADPSPTLKLDRLWVTLQPDASNGFPQNPGARVNATGTFVLRNIPPGKYRVNVRGFPPQYYPKSATLDGADVLQDGLILTAGVPQGKLAFFLSLDGGTIEGTALDKDGNPVAGIRVVLIPDPPRRNREDLYSDVETDSRGMFTLPGLAPGYYKIFAWEDLEGHSFHDPDFIRLFENRGKEVEVRRQQQQEVQVQVIPISAMPSQ